jgi:hypothetical protein
MAIQQRVGRSERGAHMGEDQDIDRRIILTLVLETRQTMDT